MFKIKGDNTNYLLDNQEDTIDPALFKVLILVLSGSATQRSVKEALKKARRRQKK